MVIRISKLLTKNFKMINKIIKGSKLKTINSLVL